MTRGFTRTLKFPCFGTQHLKHNNLHQCLCCQHRLRSRHSHLNVPVLKTSKQLPCWFIKPSTLLLLQLLLLILLSGCSSLNWSLGNKRSVFKTNFKNCGTMCIKEVWYNVLKIYERTPTPCSGTKLCGIMRVTNLTPGFSTEDRAVLKTCASKLRC